MWNDRTKATVFVRVGELFPHDDPGKEAPGKGMRQGLDQLRSPVTSGMDSGEAGIPTHLYTVDWLAALA